MRYYGIPVALLILGCYPAEYTLRQTESSCEVRGEPAVRQDALLTQRIKQIKPGMTSAEVLKIMGAEPTRRWGRGGRVWGYQFDIDSLDLSYDMVHTGYLVAFEDGSVTAVEDTFTCIHRELRSAPE